ncbi:MAG: DASH family cryptochrome [Polyangiaceae bacterium]|nr:DASH family cryptochrome [Polyangiaceae bacterium]
MTTGLLWLRSDLRLVDHEPLRQLASTCDRLLLLYCIDPRLFEATPWGFSRMGIHRARFLIQTLEALRAELRDHGSELVIRVGAPLEVIPQLAAEYRVDVVAFHLEAAIDERQEEMLLQRRLASHVRLCTAWGHTLVPLEQLPFKLEALPKSFTPFRKKVEASASCPLPSEAPSSLPPAPSRLSPGALPTLEQFGLENKPLDARVLNSFRGGCQSARQQLHAYVWEYDRLRSYKETRNGMLVPEDSTKISPWLALGSLTPREVHQEIIKYEETRISNESTYWLKFELLWRDYFRFVTHQGGARLFRLSGLRERDKDWHWSAELFERWCEGKTGCSIVDACMIELSASGFLSNRGRQIVASYLVNDLNLDWRAGAAWFEYQLIDYDPCSNYGNWNYLAGVGNDPRTSRYFDPQKQAERYDPKGEYQRHWLRP